MTRFLAFFFLASLIPSVSLAGPLEDGLSAYESGDYPTAIPEIILDIYNRALLMVAYAMRLYRMSI